MRLFVALVPPAEALEHLDRGVAAVRREIGEGPLSSAGVPLLRWTIPEQWHLTLVFLGNVDDALRPALERRLRRAAARHRPLRLFLQGAGRFGGPSTSRVLWTGVGGEVEPLRRLARSVHAAAARTGLDVGEARFRAHVTLARLREPGDIRSIVERLDAYSGPEFVADRISLIGSHLGQGEGRRPRYETVASWEIGGPSSSAPNGADRKNDAAGGGERRDAEGGGERRDAEGGGERRDAAGDRKGRGGAYRVADRADREE